MEINDGQSLYGIIEDGSGFRFYSYDEVSRPIAQSLPIGNIYFLIIIYYSRYKQSLFRIYKNQIGIVSGYVLKSEKATNKVFYEENIVSLLFYLHLSLASSFDWETKCIINLYMMSVETSKF